MGIDNPKNTSPEYAAWKDDFIRKIRERSAKPTSRLRKEYAETQVNNYAQAITHDTGEGKWIKKNYAGDPVRFFLSYYFANPKLKVSTLDDYYKFHEKEDVEKDCHMITSADLLDLQTSSLDDFLQTGIAGHHSRKTDALLKKVTNGLLWALDVEGRKEKEDNPRGGYGFLDWRDRLSKAKLTRNNRQTRIVIDQIIGAIHANDTGGDPLAGNHLVRDLLFEKRGEVDALLNFLGNL